MPITLPCTCGKNLQVKEDLAGKRIKCPGCGGVLAVPAAAAEPEPIDLEPLDDDAPDPAGAAAEAGPRAPVKKKKKKKKKQSRAKTREEVDEEFDQWVQRSYWRKRMFRGGAFITLGLIIVMGALYLLIFAAQDVKPYQSVLLLLIGIGGIVKGLFGLFFGQFFGEDE
jgi:hypothetical protein